MVEKESIEYNNGKKYKVVYDITDCNDPPDEHGNVSVPLMVEISREEIKSVEMRVAELEARILVLEGK